MKKNIIITLFLICAAGQLFFSLSSLINRENILKKGSIHKFRTRLLDPYDPFRGKYLALEVDQSIKTENPENYEEGEKVFVAIKLGVDEYSNFSEIADGRPEGNDYIRLKIDHINDDQIFFDVPFDRYYIDEDYAEKAENAYWTELGDKSAYIELRILNGSSVLRELFFEDTAVLDYLKP